MLQDTDTDTLVWWLRNTILRGYDNDDLESRAHYMIELAEELYSRFPNGPRNVSIHNCRLMHD